MSSDEVKRQFYPLLTISSFVAGRSAPECRDWRSTDQYFFKHFFSDSHKENCSLIISLSYFSLQAAIKCCLILLNAVVKRLQLHCIKGGFVVTDYNLGAPRNLEWQEERLQKLSANCVVYLSWLLRHRHQFSFSWLSASAKLCPPVIHERSYHHRKLF